MRWRASLSSKVGAKDKIFATDENQMHTDEDKYEFDRKKAKIGLD
jgi:hypothetical protein